MIELNDFYNDGFGWHCRHCERELDSERTGAVSRSRIFSEGEAGSREMESAALAKWTDKTRRSLTCPRCGITEPVERS